MLSRVLSLLILAFYVTIGIAGCSSQDDDGAEMSAQIASAWAEFESGNFTSARDHFLEVLQSQPANVEAGTGAGWCLIRLDDPMGAESFLHVAFTNDASYANAAAGYGIALVLLNDFQSALLPLVTVLTGHGDDYVFDHDTSVTSRDLRILYALASFHSGNFATAQAQVEILDPTALFDPSSPTYEAELLAAIERLLG